ncbi:hypothetical protein TGAM01_v206968 [Trichoderma gamsii]|uniref:Uncharacterized protein n=1 Tax=Trichoderma gamsii TaxID=398673 RepID=A0A0W7VSF3_9HYPO|nr:hypothetical protein TGAM01_v206968 [Trichoderma gamsii]PNP39634.1 hypothetical protein TGAMA5MH_08452 [Trichoderma gamsii]PON24280.1 hypothetical protein TGAM01_v206968 [Trichoderma gamsii]
MGLPLFVAPVETDLPAKQPKHDALSLARSGIRRSTYVERRDRRHPRRRRISDLPVSAPGREALRDVTSGGERQRDGLEEQMSSLYGGTWHGVDTSGRAEEGGQEGEIGWWSSDPRLRPRHARIAAVISNPRRSRSPLPPSIGSVIPGSFIPSNRLPPFRLLDGELERIPFEPSTSLDDVSTLDRYRSLRRNQSRMYRALLSRRSQPDERHSRTQPVDGLGDRDRSLSPEGWDTLRSTLTPDPQPPSAGSSFVSAAATQGAGPSNPPPSAPELPDGTMDPACESGHENSDDEDTYFGYPGYRGIRHAHRRIRQLVPEYNLDGPSDGPRSQQTQSSGPSGDVLANHYSQLLFGQTGSEDERRLDRLRLIRDESSGSGPSTHTGDEEWLGMQRIVRSLAAREDIPDEWWAGAGLNRTLPREGSN